MVKHTQTIRRQFADESVFDHFVGLALKGLTKVHFSPGLINEEKLIYYSLKE